MTWKRLDVVFILRSPLHIGYLPSKGLVIAPTRYYVTGRTVWGAITKKAAENLCRNTKAVHYETIGEDIKKGFRFGYLFPYDGEVIYVPEYTAEGLKYGDKNKINALEFEHRFISSRVLTKMNHGKGISEDKSLHEIEFLKGKYRDERSNVKDTRIIGCIWVRSGCALNTENGKRIVETNENGIFVEECNLIESLTLGGEQNYGFGIVTLESINKTKFQIRDTCDTDEVEVCMEKGDAIFSHLEYDKDIPFEGDIELLSGREYSQTPSKPQYYFSPGTIIKEKEQFVMRWSGIMRAMR